ncbi:MAG: hypothetical protein HC800_14550 [Phormidesmis sp. RL_2_1]|nr:hypothetical protein [Phormidesmis sp. RL_2_1]
MTSSSGETLRRRTALRKAHQDKVRMHPYFAVGNKISANKIWATQISANKL